MNLPKVFQNSNIKTNNISQNVFYSEKNHENSTSQVIESPYMIEKKINDLFNSSNYVYKLDVLIKTKEDEFKTTIIGRSQKYLITIDNKKIDITSILDIRELSFSFILPKTLVPTSALGSFSCFKTNFSTYSLNSFSVS